MERNDTNVDGFDMQVKDHRMSRKPLKHTLSHALKTNNKKIHPNILSIDKFMEYPS